MVNLVDVLVQRSPVYCSASLAPTSHRLAGGLELQLTCSVSDVVEQVLKDEEEGDLGGHEERWREGHLVRRHAKVAADRVEQEDEGQLARKVGEKHRLGALPQLSLRHALALHQSSTIFSEGKPQVAPILWPEEAIPVCKKT